MPRCIWEYWQGKFWRIAHDSPIFPPAKIFPCTLLLLHGMCIIRVVDYIIALLLYPLQKVTHKCFIKCVYAPGSDLDSREKVKPVFRSVL